MDRSYAKNFATISSLSRSNSRNLLIEEDLDPDHDAKFTNLNLNAISAQAVVNTLSQHVNALNFAHNKIAHLPRHLPPKLIGLNLAFNMIHDLKGIKGMTHLVELNLSHNFLER